jgi:hypothetical protein
MRDLPAHMAPACRGLLIYPGKPGANFPCSASVSNSSSGIVDWKYDSLLASAKSSSLPGFSLRKEKLRRDHDGQNAARIACSTSAFRRSFW